MAITYVQSGTGHSTGTSGAASYSSSVTAGNLLVAVVMSDTDSATLTTLSDTRGNTYTAATTATTQTGVGTLVGIFYVSTASGGANTVTAVCSGGGVTIHVAEYSGVATSSPLDIATQATGNSAAPSATATTTQSGDLIVGGFLNNRSTLTAGTGYTVRQDFVFNQWVDLEDKVVGAGGSYAADGTMTSGGQWCAHFAAFKALGAQTATKVAFGTQPANSVSGSVMAPFTVNVQDVSSALVTGSAATVTLTASSGTLSGTTSVTASGGVATFSNVTSTGVVTGETLTAASSGLTSATSTTFNVTAAPPPSTITLVQSASNRSSTGTVTTNFASPVTAGNLLVAIVASDSDATTLTNKSDTLGNTYSVATSPTTNTGIGTLVGVLYAANTPSGANGVTVICAGTGISLVVAEYSGVATSSPLDGVVTGQGVNTPPSVSATTTVNGNLLVGAVWNNRSTLTPATGYTLRQDVVFNQWLDVADKVAGASGSYSAGGTMASGGQWCAHLATFTPGTVTPITPTKLLYGTQPTNSVSGQSVPAFTVRITDSGGTTVSTATNTVTITGTLGALTGTLSAAAVNGIASFANVIDTGVNTGETLTAAASGLTSATSTAFNVTALATGGALDLTQLPVAARQPPKWAAYQALNVPGMAAGTNYSDPTTSRRVWKLTSATFPAANSNAMHSYASGPLHVSCPWGTLGDKYTHYLFLDGSAGYIEDFQIGVGSSNARSVPWSSDLHYSFSMVTGQKAYYVDSSAQLFSYNTATGVSTLVKSFASAIGGQQLQYMELDRTDRWFVFMNQSGTIVYAWDSQTDTLKSASETRMQAFRPLLNIDEPHFDKDGRYCYIAVFRSDTGGYFNDSGTLTNQVCWDLTNDKISNTFAGWSHNEALRGITVGTDPNVGQEQCYIPAPVTADGQAPAGVLSVIATDSQFGNAASHRAGQYDQTATGRSQYYLLSVDAPNGGVFFGNSGWTNVSGSKWQTTVSYGYQQSVNGVLDVLELNSTSTAISAQLTKVADVASITGAGKWCITGGNVVTVWRTDSGQPDTAGKAMYLEVNHLAQEGLAFVKLDFTDTRLACHHYTFDPGYGDYYAFNRGTVSRDGKLLYWTSNMGTKGGRKDVFLAEMPVVATTPSQLVVLTDPSLTNVSGVAHVVQPVVKVADASGNTVTGDASTITAALVTEQGTGTAIGTLTKVASAGVASFTNLGVTSALGGLFHWAYSDGALTGARSATFKVGTDPVAAFTATGTLLTRTFDSTASTDDVGIVSRLWSFGDATTSTATAPTHTYTTAGTYTVVLTVTDGAGFTNSTTQSVTVSAATPTTLQLVTPPSTTATTNVAFAQQPSVRLLDQTGALYLVPTSITLSSTGTTLGGTQTVLTANGIATWSGVYGAVAGTAVVTAAVTNVIPSVGLGSVVVTDPPITPPPPPPVPVPTTSTPDTTVRQYVRRRHHRRQA